MEFELFWSRSARIPPARRRALDAAPTPGGWVHRRHSGSHGARSYGVYRPAGLTSRTRVPLVLLLHGCRQSAIDFAQESGFQAAADSFGFVLVAPQQELGHQLQRCWRWYDSAHQRRGMGEPALLAGVVADVLADETSWRIDRRRVYVAGLSAGGSMSLILATTYPDVFAAAGVHSATAYRSATQGLNAFSAMSARGVLPSHVGISREMAPIVLIHGTHDRVVRPPNSDRIVDQWLTSHETTRSPGLNRVRPLASTRSVLVEKRRCLRTRWYTARGRRVLEYWRIDGLGHAWSGGQTAGSYVDRSGPRAAAVMAGFFLRHRLSYGALERELDQRSEVGPTVPDRHPDVGPLRVGGTLGGTWM